MTWPAKYLYTRIRNETQDPMSETHKRHRQGKVDIHQEKHKDMRSGFRGLKR